MARRSVGYDHIVLIMSEDDRRVIKSQVPSPPPERIDMGLHTLDYVGTIWETPHYKVRAEEAT